jgi:hypothetical protein
MNRNFIYAAYQYLLWTDTKDTILKLLEEYVNVYIDAGEEVPHELLNAVSAMRFLVKEGGEI